MQISGTGIQVRVPGVLLGLLAILGMVVPGMAAEREIKVLVVTGGHGFEKDAFLRVFSETPGIDFVHAEHTKGSATVFERQDLLDHDVVVLYDMPKTITEPQKARFLSMFDRGVGLVVLHHALGSYQNWPDYERIIGGRYPETPGNAGVATPEVGYQHDVDVPVVSLAKEHPVTAGLKAFTIHDEIYWGFRVASDVSPILGTTLSKCRNPLAWTRTEGRSRVVYLQLGHDHKAYDNPNYRRLVAQAIRWVARK